MPWLAWMMQTSQAMKSRRRMHMWMRPRMVNIPTMWNGIRRTTKRIATANQTTLSAMLWMAWKRTKGICLYGSMSRKMRAGMKVR